MVEVVWFAGDYGQSTDFTAGATANCTAVETREHFADFVSIQRQRPSLPPTQNANSAVSRRLPARQFGG